MNGFTSHEINNPKCVNGFFLRQDSLNVNLVQENRLIKSDSRKCLNGIVNIFSDLTARTSIYLAAVTDKTNKFVTNVGFYFLVGV